MICLPTVILTFYNLVEVLAERVHPVGVEPTCDQLPFQHFIRVSGYGCKIETIKFLAVEVIGNDPIIQKNLAKILSLPMSNPRIKFFEETLENLEQMTRLELATSTLAR